LTDLRLPQCKPQTLIVDPFPPTIINLSGAGLGAGLQAYLRLSELGRPYQFSILSLRVDSPDCHLLSLFKRVGSTAFRNVVEISAWVLWFLHAGPCGGRHNIHIVLVPLEAERLDFEHDI